MSFADALRVHALEGKVAALEDEVRELRQLVTALGNPPRAGAPPPPVPEVVAHGVPRPATANERALDPEPSRNAPNGEYQKWLARRDARRGARSNAA